MSTADFLTDLERRQVTVRVIGDRLHCAAPDGVLTAEVVERIRERKPEILRHLRDRNGIPSADRSGPLPLSFAQERMWLSAHLDADDSAYHLPLAVRLDGPLTVGALDQALAEIVRRHEILRTRYPVRRGRPCQEIGPPAAALPVVDLSGLPPAVRESAALGLTEREARRPFDLATGPVQRTTVLRCGPITHRLLLTRHHIASDGWSLGVLGTELSTLYGAFLAGTPSPLPPLPLQFADFALWQRDWQRRADGAEPRLDVLAGLLDGASPDIGLVGDPVSDGTPPPVGTMRRTIDAGLTERLGRTARDAGSTVYTTLLAALAVVVAAAAGREKVIVGSPAAGRPRPELEPLVGAFATMLPVVVDTTGDPTFRDVLRRVHRVVVAALDVQDALPDTRVGRPRTRRGSSPFTLVLTYQNTPSAGLVLPGLTAVTEGPVAVAPKFPLTVTATAADGAHDLLVEFDGRRVHPAVVAALVDRFIDFLELAADRSDDRCAALVREVAGRTLEFAPPTQEVEGTTLAAAFTAAAARNPDAIALSGGGAQVTYRALRRAARRLARRLTGRGVPADGLVGVCVEPSFDTVAAIVACTLAGAAYLPLDPDDPPARHEAVIADAGISALVTSSGLADRFEWYDGPTLLVDEAWRAGRVPEKSTPAPTPTCLPDQLAYVIYTSGSTGAPKGVMVSHRNVCGLFAAAGTVHDFTGDDVWTLAHSTAFDFSVWEMWGALLHGARLVVLPRAVVLDPAELWRTVVAEQVTVFSSTPGAFEQLAGAAVDAPAGALRAVVLGGDRCDTARLRSWLDRFGAERPRLVNMYGITETTVHVTHHRLTPADLSGGADSPVGRPLPGVRAHVVDTHGAPVPVGGQGELLVGGPGVARGYLRRPALTADRFRPDDLGGAPGARLYSTGDLLRVSPDGGLGHLGRLDRQVKLRGYRIEPGEVESVLAGHPDLGAAAVTVRQDGERSYLAGYVVARPGAQPAVRELRRFLGERLPAYLVPAVIVPLDRLPLTRNGKLDYAALPPPAAPVPAAALPSTRTERVLAGMWAELLGMASADAIGVHDDFFDLGGDSLLVTRLHARLPEAFGVDLPMRQVYQALDIASLAAAIDELRLVAEAENLPKEELRHRLT